MSFHPGCYQLRSRAKALALTPPLYSDPLTWTRPRLDGGMDIPPEPLKLVQEMSCRFLESSR